MTISATAINGRDERLNAGAILVSKKDAVDTSGPSLQTGMATLSFSSDDFKKNVGKSLTLG